MTTPAIIPLNRTGTYRDFLQTKVDRSGASRTEAFNVDVASGAEVGDLVGLVPFNKGFRMNVGGTQMAVAALGADVTVNIGYVYDDDALTDDPDAFATAIAAATAGGLIEFDEVAGLRDFVAEGNGWMVAQIAGDTTGTTGAIFGQVSAVYDGLDAENNR